MNLKGTRKMKYQAFKRFLDFLLSLFALCALGPLLAVVALSVKLDSKGPVLFKQKRVGKDRELFEMLKFRTMKTETPKDMPTHLLERPDAYITKVGSFLRKTSLDELPQLVNIIKGEMAVVGPRPALWNQFDLVEEREKYGANSVRPGLTGWAQVNGRDELEIPVKAKFDGEYVEKMSFFFDLKCILKTVSGVLFEKGVVEGGTGALKAGEEEKI